MLPIMEELPRVLRVNISRGELIQELVNVYLIPYFKGLNRIVSNGMEFTVRGIGFRVTDVSPGKGVVGPNTIIRYDGSMIRREYE